MSNVWKTECYKCRELVLVERLPEGKWLVTNLDGSFHWELCKQTRWQRLSPAEQAAQIKRDLRDNPPVCVIGPDVTHVWNGDVPPWSEELGEYRDFTAAERSAAAVCVPR